MFLNCAKRRKLYLLNNLNLKAVTTQPVHRKKTCTTCLQELGLHSFYSKGNRTDSVCKTCKKQKAKATYLRKKNLPRIADLNKFIKVAAELEIKMLSSFETKLENLIEERVKYEDRKKQNAA